MNIILKTDKKNYGTFSIILFFGVSLFMFGCKNDSSSSSPSSSPCAAPAMVSCGSWVTSSSSPPLIVNTPQVILSTTDVIECQNNSGLITVPSVSNGITAQLTIPLLCNLTNVGVCTCTGNIYIPNAGPPVITGEYSLNLMCVNKNTGLKETFVNIGAC